MNNSFEKLLTKSKKALLIGIGGGGDIVGTLPTAGLLELFDIEYVLAGLPWERSVIDPVPGPRKFHEIVNSGKINEGVWICNKETKTDTGVLFAETGVSRMFDKDISEFLLDAAGKLGIDLIIGIDVGGDVIANGTEKGLLSPLADSTMIAAFYNLRKKIDSFLGVFGFGSDGELSLDELENSVAVLSQNGGILGTWGITQKTLNLMKEVIKVVPTEASRSPVRYAEGKFQNTTIRSGTVKVELNYCCTSTIYIDTAVLFEKVSTLARAVADSDDIMKSRKILNNMGIQTEFDIETERYGN
jgi:hypothetical protein